MKKVREKFLWKAAVTISLIKPIVNLLNQLEIPQFRDEVFHDGCREERLAEGSLEGKVREPLI